MEMLARTCKTDSMNAQRIMARLFVIVGALFWVSAAWGAKWAYQGAPFTQALSFALIYAGTAAFVFAIGLFYENLVAVLLTAAAAAIVVFGIVAGWETGVWAVVAFFFVLPLVIAAILFALAARMQKICMG